MLLRVPVEQLWPFELRACQTQRHETHHRWKYGILLLCAASNDRTRSSQGLIVCHHFDVLVRPPGEPGADPHSQNDNRSRLDLPRKLGQGFIRCWAVGRIMHFFEASNCLERAFTQRRATLGRLKRGTEEPSHIHPLNRRGSGSFELAGGRLELFLTHCTK